MQSLYTVEKPGFRNLIHTLVVKAKMSGAKYFAATTDLWTSCNSHPYVSYTVHFIDDDWQLLSFCLDTVLLFEDHTGQNIAEAILDILEKWGLSREDLVATTIDNGTNFISGITQLECTRISCIGHNLDLAVNKSLNITRVQRKISRCHSLIKLFNRSWKKKRDLTSDLGVN